MSIIDFEEERSRRELAFDDAIEVKLRELRARRNLANQNAQVVSHNVQLLAEESNRVADIAHNSQRILDDLDDEFEAQTGLKGPDIAFLFLSTGLQMARIIIMNMLTSPQNAGEQNTIEKYLHEKQRDILKQFDDKEKWNEPTPLHAPINQIVYTTGVPYDCTEFLSEEIKLKYNPFKGVNHRFATLGHDPILGLLFGTTNILTNTITFSLNEGHIGKYKVPTGIRTNNVHYSVGKNFQAKHPLIGLPTSTILAISSAAKRIDGDEKAVIAALIKQIIHIGTDVFTTKGLTIPGANLVLDNSHVEKLAGIIDAGDLVKAGANYEISRFINCIISTLHALMYDSNKYESIDVYTVKTRKILLYSNCIASGSNLLWVGSNMAGGNESAIQDLDVGGLIVTIQRLLSDPAYIMRIKEEFVFGKFEQMIRGDEIVLEEVHPWALEGYSGA